jgi:hypothetical protein
MGRQNRWETNQMKTKFSIALSTIATVVALTFASASKPVLAQEKGGERTKPTPLAKRGDASCACDPWTAPGDAAFADRSVYLNEFLQRPGGLEDKRYFRCNTSRLLSVMWNQQRMGNNPQASASWGNCDDDLKRESILSPYSYRTAKEHDEALLAAAKAKGGPTVYTKATVPDWDGYFRRDAQADHGSEWIWGVSQAPTVLSVLTPEYQKRMAQLIYHEPTLRSGTRLSAIPKDSSAGGRSLRRRETSSSRGAPGTFSSSPAIADNFLRQSDGG